MNNGITILPELALRDLTKKQQKNIRYFRSPAPVREVSIVTYRYFIKYNLIEMLKKEILASLPTGMKEAGKNQITQID